MLSETIKTTIKVVVVNHFQEDFLEGLEAFQYIDISNYANNKTIELALDEGSKAPQVGFKNKLIMEIGQDNFFNRYFGEPHTEDNIIRYIPNELVLFGGCMVKAPNGQKDNLADANINVRSKSKVRIKMAYAIVKIIFPDHGKPRETDLLDFTITLFNKP